jgi:hypothetical protein
MSPYSNAYATVRIGYVPCVSNYFGKTVGEVENLVNKPADPTHPNFKLPRTGLLARNNFRAARDPGTITGCDPADRIYGLPTSSADLRIVEELLL